jgi:hypothetical protein
VIAGQIPFASIAFFGGPLASIRGGKAGERWSRQVEGRLSQARSTAPRSTLRGVNRHSRLPIGDSP